jgi:hypothetical protein
MSSWEHEQEWRGLLVQAAKSAKKELVEHLADLAVRDDKVVRFALLGGRLHPPAAPRPQESNHLEG